jgi:hypothetical protein
MDLYRTASPVVSNGTPVYFKPQTNGGVLGALAAGNGSAFFDVVHVINSSGATAWFRYRARTGFQPLCPHLLVPVVSAGISGGGGFNFLVLN